MSNQNKITSSADRKDIHKTTIKLHTKNLEQARTSVELTLLLNEHGWNINEEEVREIARRIERLIEQVQVA